LVAVVSEIGREFFNIRYTSHLSKKLSL